jgi:hypothetical protein
LKLGNDVCRRESEIVALEGIVKPGIAMGEENQRLRGTTPRLNRGTKTGCLELGNALLVSVGAAGDVGVD